MAGNIANRLPARRPSCSLADFSFFFRFPFSPLFRAEPHSARALRTRQLNPCASVLSVVDFVRPGVRCWRGVFHGEREPPRGLAQRRAAKTACFGETALRPLLDEFDKMAAAV
jgi:hypothetical protein